MKVALIKNGKVENIIISDGLAIPGDWDYIIDTTGTSVGIDWDYDGSDFTDNRPTSDPE